MPSRVPKSRSVAMVSWAVELRPPSKMTAPLVIRSVPLPVISPSVVEFNVRIRSAFIVLVLPMPGPASEEFRATLEVGSAGARLL